MNCPFYLVVAAGYDYHIDDETTSTCRACEINSNYLDIDDKQAVINYVKSHVSNDIRLDSIMIIANDTVGAPKVVHHWKI